MTRQPHDNFAKEYLEELLTNLGKVEKSKEILGEVRQIDIWFIPQKKSSQNTNNLGILAKMAHFPALFEPYRNAPTESQIKDCLLKLLVMENEIERKNKRDPKKQLEEKPYLWILAPTFSERIVNNFQAKLDLNNWCEGVYFLAPSLNTALIAINQLPKTPDTLLIRVLGKGKTQGDAVKELVSLSEKNPAQKNILEVLASWQKNLEIRQKNNQLTEEEKEDFMNLSPAYLQQREEWKIEGIKEGIKQGIKEIALNLLKQNLDIPFIVKVTGLSEETLIELQKTLTE